MPIVFESWAILGGDVVNVQYGTITIADTATSGTATIVSVDTTISCVVFLGSYSGANLGNVTETHYLLRLDLTNSTTVTATRQGSAYVIVCDFMVITFAGVKSLQQGTLSIANGASSGTATITSVNTSKAILFNNGWTIGTNSETAFADRVGLTLTNGTTVTGTRFGTTNAVTVGYVVVEFN